MEKHIPEILKPVSVLSPETTDNAPNSDWLDLSDCHMAYLVVSLTQAASHETTITVEEDEAGTGGAAQTVANNVRIWHDVNVDDDEETLDRQDDGTNHDAESGTDNQLMVFQVDPRALSDGFTHVRLGFQDSSQSDNFASVVAYKEPRYQG